MLTAEQCSIDGHFFHSLLSLNHLTLWVWIEAKDIIGLNIIYRCNTHYHRGLHVHVSGCLHMSTGLGCLSKTWDLSDNYRTCINFATDGHSNVSIISFRTKLIDSFTSGEEIPRGKNAQRFVMQLQTNFLPDEYKIQSRGCRSVSGDYCHVFMVFLFWHVHGCTVVTDVFSKLLVRYSSLIM